MTTAQIKTAIKVVANATNATEQEVINKMMAKDYWTMFLIEEAAR